VNPKFYLYRFCCTSCLKCFAYLLCNINGQDKSREWRQEFHNTEIFNDTNFYNKPFFRALVLFLIKNRNREVNAQVKNNQRSFMNKAAMHDV
jgi:hypothetical protein